MLMQVSRLRQKSTSRKRGYYQNLKRDDLKGGRLFFCCWSQDVSLTDTELFLCDNRTVAVDVFAHQIVEQ